MSTLFSVLGAGSKGWPHVCAAPVVAVEELRSWFKLEKVIRIDHYNSMLNSGGLGQVKNLLVVRCDYGAVLDYVAASTSSSGVKTWKAVMPPQLHHPMPLQPKHLAFPPNS
jgi:hypothetical protein